MTDVVPGVATRLIRIAEDLAGVVDDLKMITTYAAAEAVVSESAPPEPQEKTWLTVDEASKRVNRHRGTLNKAACAGLLHGHQRGRKCRWAFAPGALDAYIRGEGEAAQLDACGCQRVALRGRRSARD